MDSATFKRLIAKANKYLESSDFEKALKISIKLLSKNPQNIEALELSSTIALEIGDSETALKHLNKAIDLQPGRNHRLYLSKAQIVDGKESLECYQSAIQILLGKIRVKNGGEFTARSSQSCSNASSSAVEAAMDIDEQRSNAMEGDNMNKGSDESPERELSTVYCSVAELFFTDLCDEADAEDACKKALDNALEHDPTNAEAHITKARYLNIIGEVVQAKTVLEESRPLWTVEFQEDGSKASELPAPLRLAAAKLFIELEMHEDAQSILDSLLDESDQVVEVHYLSGWNSYLQGQEHHSDALQHLKNAKTCESQFPCDDPELVEHISDLLAELGYDASQEEEDDEDGWTDAEDEQEMEREIIEEAGEASDDDL